MFVCFSAQGLSQTYSVPFTYQAGGTAPDPAHYNIFGTTGLALTLTTDNASWVTSTLSSTNIPSTLTITINPAGLAAGNYTSTTTIGSIQGSLIFNISLQVTAAASGTLTLSTTGITFNAVAGAAAPASQSIGVTATSTTSASAQVSEQTCTSSNWLSISPSGSFTAGTTSTNFAVSVNQAGLAAGTTCSGTVSMTAGANTQTATVTLNVTATPAALTLSSSTFTFSGVAGGAVPATQTLTVTAASTTNASAQVSEQTCTGSNWLSLSPTGNFSAGTASTTFTIAVNQSGLAAGTTCSGTISMTAAAVTQTATVTLNVTAGASALTLNATSFTFNAVAGIAPPVAQTLTVTAASSTLASAQASENSCTGSTWLSISPTGTFTASAAATNITVSVNQSGLPAGTTCSGTISLTAGSNTQTVSVTLNVTGLTVTTLTVSPTAYTFSAVANDVVPAAMTISVTAPAVITANAQLTEQTCTTSNWLSLSPTGSFTAGPTTVYFTVSVNQAGMVGGTTCNGTITISSSAGTQTVSVTMSVISLPAGVLTLSPSALTFTSVAGGTPPTPQTLSVTAAFNTSATAQVSKQSCANSAWITLSPTGSFTASSTSTFFTVTVDPTGIAGGTTCNGLITMSANSGVRSVPVTLTVTGAAQLTLSATQFSFNAIVGAGAPASQTLTVASQSTMSASAQASQVSCTGINWLSLSPTGSFTAGPTTTNFTVAVNPSGITAGTTCTGTISMVSAAGTQTLPVTMAVTTAPVTLPTVSATPTTLAFTYTVGDPAPTPQQVAITGAGSIGTFSVSVAGASWLKVSPACTVAAPCSTPNTGIFSLMVTADPSGLNAAAAYFGTIVISGVGQSTGTTNVNVSLAVAAPLPAITLVTNAASFVTGPVAPGEMISIFANPETPIGPATAVALNGTTCPAPCTDVPTTMGGVQVTFQPGGVAAPLTYVSATQVNCMVPYEVLGAGTVKVEVKYLGQKSNALSLQYAPTQPGIFTALGTGTGLASVQQFDAQGNYQGQNSSSNPGKAGWHLMFYVTGEGIIPTPAVTGRVTSTPNVVPLLGPPTVLIDSLAATVTYFAEANGLVSGLLQVNAVVPAGVHTGQAVPLTLSMNGNNSQPGVVIYMQ